MQPQILVVSDPPHGDVEHDAVAETLGLDPDNVRLKVSFPAPEVLAASDPDRARAIAGSLTDAGMSVVVVDGYGLAGIPWPQPASSVSLTSDALIVGLGDRTLEVPYEAGILGVYFRPPTEVERRPGTDLAEALRHGNGSAVADALEWATHLDLYLGQGGRTERISIVDDASELVDALEDRFERLDVDRRLEEVRPRQRFVAGVADFDMDLRKAFSFGTLLLRQVLESISPDLRDVPQYEFASRLSYVLWSRSDAG